MASPDVKNNKKVDETVPSKVPSHPLFVASPRAPAAILHSIEGVYLFSDICNPCSIQASIVFSSLKPFYIQPNCSFWWSGIFCMLISSNLVNHGRWEWPCVYLPLNLRSIKVNEVHASHRKSMEVDASGWPNEMQVKCKSKTCVDLPVRLANA